MEQRNNKQDRIIFEIEALLNKMSNQVNFLIRKEMPMNQLDVDLLMENTRKLYDTICSVELGVRSEELGVKESRDVTPVASEELEVEKSRDVTPVASEELEVEESRDVTPVASEELEVGSEELGVEDFEEEDYDDDFEVDVDNDEIIDFESKDEDDDEVDDADMVWDFTKDELGVEKSRDVTPVASEELGVEESRDVTPVASEELGVRSEELEESEKEEDSGIRAYRIIRENIPTLGDMLEQSEDKSLAARLQRKPVSDLITAIGINDKFLFLNELFGGSMEKYNKSIRSLNSFSTLLGAKTYMSELQIEFQWDCTSDAYKKLNDLVERRFI